ncbi:hypothetical protein GJ744_008871 [Endocarpon pusillum]|uniref:Uncharacterized protein n=1 Tax=Endocarpon pusillum TaxID=364733 RepID=A0A8H7AV98_9EURO|nr:hypothetical protein GJ744_008871 [Endocarpon pusillum]
MASGIVGIDVIIVTAGRADGAFDPVDFSVVDSAPFAGGFNAITVPAGWVGLIWAADEYSIAVLSAGIGVGYGFGFSVAWEENG